VSLHLAADLEANYARFIRRVRETKVVWGLRSDRGWAICPSSDRTKNVLPFWSDQAYAKRHCVNEWSSYIPEAIPLGEFVAAWLKGMHSDGALVGVNFNADLAGLEIEPLALAKEVAVDL
jgi:hypothetical protein